MRLTVGLAKPKVLPFEFPKQVNAGDSVTVVCVAKGSSPVRYEWSKDGLAFSRETASIVASDELSTIHIKSLQATHAGNYTCTASNAFGSDSFSARIRVQSESRFFLISPLINTAQQLLHTGSSDRAT